MQAASEFPKLGIQQKEKNGHERGAADQWQTRPQEKRKPRQNGIKFAAKNDGAEACDRRRANAHRDRKTGWCQTTQAVKSLAPANGN